MVIAGLGPGSSGKNSHARSVIPSAQRNSTLRRSTISDLRLPMKPAAWTGERQDFAGPSEAGPCGGPQTTSVVTGMLFRPGRGRRRRSLPAKLAPNYTHQSPNALIGDSHTALGQDQLDITKTQAEHVVEPDRMADEIGREAVAIVRIWRRLHHAILGQAAAARLLP